MTEDDLNQEHILFYEKVASYVSRHPEFVEELQKRMDEEEKLNSKQKFKGKSSRKNYSSNESYAKEENTAKNQDDKNKTGFFKLDEEKINTISKELSGMLFDKDSSNKSVLETTVQDAFAGMVKNYLSKYAG